MADEKNTTKERPEKAPIADPDLTRRMLRYSHNAMATYFEVFVFGEERADARGVAEAVFGEVDRLEQDLSSFIPYSDVSRVNRAQAGAAVRVSRETFDCLALSKKIWRETGGVFDPTVGGLLRGRQPWDIEEDIPRGGVKIAEDQAPRKIPIGMNLIVLDEKALTVTKQDGAARIDLGGIGKGLALDVAAEILEDWEIETALLSGGHSTMLTRGAPPKRPGWPMRLLDPRDEKTQLGRFHVKDLAVSASANRGPKDSHTGDHIINPKTRLPAKKWAGTWSVAPTGAEADALSTAFMMMDGPQVDKYCLDHPKVRGILIAVEGDKLTVNLYGDWRSLGWERTPDSKGRLVLTVTNT